MKTATRIAHDTIERLASLRAKTLTGENAVTIAASAILTDRKQIRQTGMLSRFAEAYEAYDGDDVGTFIHTWEDYLAGEDEPCPATDDGLHQVTSGSCDQCGSKNRT